MKVNPEIAIHSEESGCDYMAMHEDGSWSHTLWTTLSGDEAYNPAGLNYFRFVLPEFKMYEIPSYRHALWRCKLAFFNGEGLWTNVPDKLRQELFVKWMPTLREHAETFLSTDIKPAIRAVSPPLYMNRFRRGRETIYTLYNAGLRTRIAEVRLPLPKGGHVFDLLSLEEMPFERDGDEAILRLAVHPHEVKCFAIMPRLLRATRQGALLEVEISPDAKEGRLLLALVDEKGVRRKVHEVKVRKGREKLKFDLRRLFGSARGKVLLRLISQPHDTASQTAIQL